MGTWLSKGGRLTKPSDSEKRKRNFEDLRSENEGHINHYWGLPPGSALRYPPNIVDENFYPRIVSSALGGLAALKRQDAWFSKHGLDNSQAFWSEIFSMVTWANYWVIDHKAAERFDIRHIHEWARVLAGLAAYSTVQEDADLSAHEKALRTLLIAFDDEKARKSVMRVAAKSSPRARALLEKVLIPPTPATPND